MPLTRGPELSGTEDAGILEDGGVPEESAAEDAGTLKEGDVPEESAAEESIELEADSSWEVSVVLPRRMISPIRSRNSTPTVTIKRIVRLSLR